MPIEIRRFGVGNRRPDGPAGTTGVSGQVIHSDARGTISELAFRPNGRVELHTNPNTTWFVVIEGGGWVVVDSERTRIAAGEAALWPADIPHGAWADRGHMRAFVVEFAGADDSFLLDVLPGRALAALGAGAADAADTAQATSTTVGRGLGELHGHEAAGPADPEAGEPH
jgi:quercetin dioxygenase-like cupin family protein